MADKHDNWNRAKFKDDPNAKAGKKDWDGNSTYEKEEKARADASESRYWSILKENTEARGEVFDLEKEKEVLTYNLRYTLLQEFRNTHDDDDAPGAAKYIDDYLEQHKRDFIEKNLEQQEEIRAERHNAELERELKRFGAQMEKKGIREEVIKSNVEDWRTDVTILQDENGRVLLPNSVDEQKEKLQKLRDINDKNDSKGKKYEFKNQVEFKVGEKEYKIKGLVVDVVNGNILGYSHATNPESLEGMESLKKLAKDEPEVFQRILDDAKKNEPVRDGSKAAPDQQNPPEEDVHTYLHTTVTSVPNKDGNRVIPPAAPNRPDILTIETPVPDPTQNESTGARIKRFLSDLAGKMPDMIGKPAQDFIDSAADWMGIKSAPVIKGMPSDMIDGSKTKTLKGEMLEGKIPHLTTVPSERNSAAKITQKALTNVLGSVGNAAISGMKNVSDGLLATEAGATVNVGKLAEPSKTFR